MDARRYVFRQAIYKGIEGREWEELYHHYRDLSKAVGAKKPSESQKAEAPWALGKESDETGAVGRIS